MRKRVFIHSEDAELAVQLVRLLDRHGVTGYWLTEEEGEKPWTGYLKHSTIRSAITRVGRLVFARGIVGMTDASAT